MSNIGKPVYFSEDKKKSFAPQWKLAEGSNVYRILPPFGSLAPKGLWSWYHAIHWGYKASNGKMRPFSCIRQIDFKTKKVKVECPQCVENKKFEDAEKSERDKYVQMGKHKDEINQLLKHYSDRRKLYNSDRKHYLNVMRQDGQIGILKLSSNAMKALRAEIKRLVETGEAPDPIGITDGVWFDFYRTGMDRDSTFKVSPVMEFETINGRRMASIKPAPLTDDILARMEKEARDLADMYKSITRDQIQILVESEGDPDTVDSVFGAPTISNNAVQAASEEEEFYPDEEDELVGSPATVAKQISEEEELLKRLEELKKTKLAKAAPVDPAPTDDLDPDKFLRDYKAGKL